MKTYTKPELQLKIFGRENMITASSYAGKETNADDINKDSVQNVVTINYEKLNIVW